MGGFASSFVFSSHCDNEDARPFERSDCLFFYFLCLTEARQQILFFIPSRPSRGRSSLFPPFVGEIPVTAVYFFFFFFFVPSLLFSSMSAGKVSGITFPFLLEFDLLFPFSQPTSCLELVHPSFLPGVLMAGEDPFSPLIPPPPSL